MTKVKHTTKLQKRDWAIIGLIFAVIATNWVWYQHHQAQELSLRSGVESWLQQQIQINKLTACINDNAKPCEGSAQFEQ